MKFAALLVAGAMAAAPIITAPEHAITNRWIVVFDNHDFGAFKSSQILAQASQDIQLDRQYNINNGSFLGVAGHFQNEEAVTLMAELPGVAFVEQDALAFVHGWKEEDAKEVTEERPISQTGHWGLDRADGEFDNTYILPASNGEGAVVYILDTGIRTTHNDYDGRAEFGNNFSTSPNGDRHGHGTHCGCTATGETHGVASYATVVDCKVLSDAGSGAFSGIISGVDWSDNDCRTRGHNVCVQSMSLGGGVNAALNAAVDAASESHSLVAVSSGNGNGNSCNQSPASAEGAWTVNSAQRNSGSNTISRSSFSNYGTCSNTCSAGSSVLSCGVSSDSATATMSGTSMSCPHVAGHAASCISYFGASTVEEVKTCLSRFNVDGQVSPADPNGDSFYTQFADF